MFFTNDKNFFLEAQITFFASLVIWFTIPEYFPLHVKGSVGIFEGAHLFGQFASRFFCSRVGKMSSDFCTLLCSFVATKSNQERIKGTEKASPIHTLSHR